MSAPHRAYCTYFDQNYLVRAVTLYQSLARHSTTPFTLWMLCFDEESHGVVSSLGLPFARALHAAELEQHDAELHATKTTRSLVEYYWTSTPALTLWLLERESTDVVCYLDADLFFYSSPEALFAELDGKSVLIIPHRFPDPTPHLLQHGVYNVGALLFRRDAVGIACLRRWRAQCIEWCAAVPESSRFGDQKYLDEWPALYGTSLVVSQNVGAGIGPWNERALHLEASRGPCTPPRAGGVDVVFFHFHGLRTLTPRIAQVASMYRIRAVTKRLLYAPYLAAHRAAWERVRRARPAFGAGLGGLTVRGLVSSVRHRALLVSSRIATLFIP